MSTYKIYFAGSGGQGILLMGQILATAAMLEDKSSTFFPSYGPEMRGGTANCTVVVSDREISCPLIYEADHVVAMNLPSLLKFESALKPGGTLFLNESIIRQDAKRGDITVCKIPVNDMAAGLGNTRVANMIMLGALIRTSGIVSPGTAEKAIRRAFGEKKADLVDINIKAFNHWREGAI